MYSCWVHQTVRIILKAEYMHIYSKIHVFKGRLTVCNSISLAHTHKDRLYIPQATSNTLEI